MEASLVYGWYGKVPCLGDFVRSGLSPQFVSAWDEWMQKLLTTADEELGDRWGDCYFSAPIWRFAISAGMTGPRAVAGIVMPSVDRVGRQYPLCLAVEIDAPVWIAYQAVEPIFASLEEAALAMLEDGSSLPFLKEMLMRLPLPRTPPLPRLSTIGLGKAIVADDSPEFALAAFAVSEPSSIWIANVKGTNRMLMTSTLPSDPQQATALFDIHSPQWVFQN